MNVERFKGRINYEVHPDLALIAIKPGETRLLIEEFGWLEPIRESRAGLVCFPCWVGMVMHSEVETVYGLIAVKHLETKFKVRLILAVAKPGSDVEPVIAAVVNGMLAHYQASQ